MLPHFGFGLRFGFWVWIYGFSGYDFVGFSLDQDRLVFLGSGFVWFLRIGIRLVFLGSEFVWFLRIGIRLVFLVWIVGFLKELDALFFRIGLFRLLIQRCKNVTGWGSLFDQGEVWLDESKTDPTNGALGVPEGVNKGGHVPPARRAIINGFATGGQIWLRPPGAK